LDINFKGVVDNVLGDGLKLRVYNDSSVNKSLVETLDDAMAQGKTLKDILTEPEQQGWVYPNGQNYMCSALVTGLL
jgi:hypothetical protein